MSQTPSPLNAAAEILAKIEEVVANRWILVIILLFILVKYFLLKQTVKQIAACLLRALAFLIHHAVSIFLRLSVSLRSLADELERSDREDKERAKTNLDTKKSGAP